MIRQSQWKKHEGFLANLLAKMLIQRKSKFFLKFFKKDIQLRMLNSSIALQKDQTPHLNVISVGNSHLDSAWLWRKSDTREKKLFPTFSRAIYHIDKYPFFTYSANAVVYYEWVREDYPELFQEIKDAVRENRWEIVGGDWMEMDVNLPNGESLVRQRLIGQRFFLKEFQRVADIAWFDDVFGFCQSLPQILVKSGAKYFYTNKFCYNHYSIQFDEQSPKYAGGEKFPFFHFLWQSPDGSQILSSWVTHKNNFHKHLKQFIHHSRTVKEGIDNRFDYSMTWPEMDAKLSETVIPYLLNTYGKGDGGMGPRPLEIITQFAWQTIGYVQIGLMKTFFEDLEPYRQQLPQWHDELYLENHQGTLTTVGMIKENNHTAEVMMQQAESLAGTIGGIRKGYFSRVLYRKLETNLISPVS